METIYNVKEFKEASLELDTIISGLNDTTKSKISRHISIINRSIENLDKMLGLFDLEDENNAINAKQLGDVIKDHINYRYNVQQPGSPMVDYEITSIQSWIKDLFNIIERSEGLDGLPEQIRKNKTETTAMIIEARAAQKKAEEEALKAHEEMERKQKELEAKKDDETRKEKQAQATEVIDDLS